MFRITEQHRAPRPRAPGAHPRSGTVRSTAPLSPKKTPLRSLPLPGPAAISGRSPRAPPTSQVPSPARLWQGRHGRGRAGPPAIPRAGGTAAPRPSPPARPRPPRQQSGAAALPARAPARTHGGRGLPGGRDDGGQRSRHVVTAHAPGCGAAGGTRASGAEAAREGGSRVGGARAGGRLVLSWKARGEKGNYGVLK